MTYDQNTHPDPIWQDGDSAVLLCHLLYGRDNNDSRARYVPVRVSKMGTFTQYLPYHRGGVRERPVSFSVTPRGLRAAQAFASRR